MCAHRKTNYYVTPLLREKIRLDKTERDIVSETVEEVLN